MVEQLEDMKHEAVQETIKHIDKGPTYIGCFNPASRCYFYPIPRSCPNKQYHSRCVAAWLCSRFSNALLYFSHLTTHSALQCWKKKWHSKTRRMPTPVKFLHHLQLFYLLKNSTYIKQTLTNKISWIIKFNTYLIKTEMTSTVTVQQIHHQISVSDSRRSVWNKFLFQKSPY